VRRVDRTLAGLAVLLGIGCAGAPGEKATSNDAGADRSSAPVPPPSLTGAAGQGSTGTGGPASPTPDAGHETGDASRDVGPAAGDVASSVSDASSARDAGSAGRAAGTAGASGGAGAVGAAGNAGAAGAAGNAGAAATGGTGAAAPPCKTSPPGYADGSVTWYTLSQGSQAVNCSYDIVRRNPDAVAHVPFGGGAYFAAMNTQDYAAAATCGACVEVTRDGTRKVSVTVVDQCPIATNSKCTAGHIDLSQEAFKQLGTVDEGYLGTSHGGAKGHISWRYIPCPVTENVSFRLKEAGGTWQAAARQPYNYWQVGTGNLGAAPYRVRATDTNGAALEARLDLRAGDQGAGSQFPECR
jgi:hypothetical protein